MESKALRELSALYLDSVCDEGCKDGNDIKDGVDNDFINKLIESGKFTEEEIQSIVDEAFKALTPDKKQAIKNQAERRKKSADRAQNASDYETSTKQDQQVRNMKAVV